MLETSQLEGAENQRLADYLMTLVHVREGNLQRAAETAERLSEAYPGAAWLLDLRGTIALLASNVARASELFDAALEADPNYVPALLNAARVALASDDRDGAAARLRRVIEIDPQQNLALLGLAQLSAQNGDFAAAQTWLENASESFLKLQLQGDIAAAQQRFGEAADAYSRAYALQPSSQIAFRSFVAAQRAGRPTPEGRLADWSARNPDDFQAQFALGGIALGKGDSAAAIAHYESVVRGVPQHAEALNNLAWLYGEAGDPRAVELGRRAHEAQPNNPAIADTLGWIYLERGEANLALPLLRQATEGAPGDAEIRYHWAVALAETGDDEARTVLSDLLDSGVEFPSRADAVQRLASLENSQR
jgi:tetratricopeptide (TPR) repeat protein